jgi:hypothetical protein
MERLTARDDYNGATYYPKCFEEPCLGGGSKSDCDTCDFNAAICNRLAAYEDTGLSPDEVALYVKCQAQSVSRRELRLGIEIERLQAQLAEAQARERAAVSDVEHAARYNCGICGVCAHHAKFWVGGGCNLINNGEPCKWQWRGPQEAGKGASRGAK